jgi:hypothetical protein
LVMGEGSMEKGGKGLSPLETLILDHVRRGRTVLVEGDAQPQVVIGPKHRPLPLRERIRRAAQLLTGRRR